VWLIHRGPEVGQRWRKRCSQWPTP
jgi:hypothetical protein